MRWGAYLISLLLLVGSGGVQVLVGTRSVLLFVEVEFVWMQFVF